MTRRHHEKGDCGASVKWLTPQWIIDAIGGPFDLDPCGCDGQCKTAERVYMLPDDDGLSMPWFGEVFLNPPFGHDNLRRWLGKMALHGNGVALLPARVDNRAWHDFVFPTASLILFPRGRVQYERGEPSTQRLHGCGFPSALAAYGERAAGRLRAATIPGSIVMAA